MILTPRRRKPIVMPDISRESYQLRIVLYYRRPWEKMTAEQRRETLQAMASALENLTDQIRAEAQEYL